MNPFAETLKTMRLKKGMSQRALARATNGGISDASICLMEQGKKIPFRPVVRLLAKALGDDEGILMRVGDDARLPPGVKESLEKTARMIQEGRKRFLQTDELSLLQFTLEDCWRRNPDGTAEWRADGPLRVERALGLLRMIRNNLGGRDAANAAGGLPDGPGPVASPSPGCRGREPGPPG